VRPAQQGTAIQVTGVTDGGIASNDRPHLCVGGFRRARAAGTPVGTSASYTPTEADEGKALQLVGTNASDPTGSESSTYSFGTVAPVAEAPTLRLPATRCRLPRRPARPPLGISVSPNDSDDVLSIRFPVCRAMRR